MSNHQQGDELSESTSKLVSVVRVWEPSSSYVIPITLYSSTADLAPRRQEEAGKLFPGLVSSRQLRSSLITDNEL